MRKLQRHGVTIYRHQADALMRSGDIREVSTSPGLYVQAADRFYDRLLGANVNGAPGDQASMLCKRRLPRVRETRRNDTEFWNPVSIHTLR